MSPRLRPLTATTAKVPTYTTCSVCLRVHTDLGWREAEVVIRQTRSFDRETAPRLVPGLCDRCEAEVRARRARSAEPLAA